MIGFHFHVGLQFHDNELHLKALEIALKLIKGTIDKYNYVTKELNIGGGFGIRYTDADL